MCEDEQGNTKCWLGLASEPDGNPELHYTFEMKRHEVLATLTELKGTQDA